MDGGPELEQRLDVNVSKGPNPTNDNCSRFSIGCSLRSASSTILTFHELFWSKALSTPSLVPWTRNRLNLKQKQHPARRRLLAKRACALHGFLPSPGPRQRCPIAITASWGALRKMWGGIVDGFGRTYSLHCSSLFRLTKIYTIGSQP